MSNLHVIVDKDNILLSRREIVCEFIRFNADDPKSVIFKVINKKKKNK